MRHRAVRRAGVNALALSLALAAIAFADTVGPDADTITPGNQSARDLGEVGPGTILNVPIAFTLTCAGLQHLDPGQSAVVEIGSATVPADGMIAMDPVTVGPVPGAWTADGDGCSGSETALQASGMVVITAPTAAGAYEYPILFDRTPTPAGLNDGSAIGGMTAASFMLTVVANTPPELVLPGDMTVEADSPAGWTAAWDVSATDAEDDPDPTSTCSSNVGDVLPIGETTVECTVTDLGGLEDTGSFVVTVLEPPTPEAPPAGTPTAVFGPPIKENGLDGHAGRTIPIKVRLMLDGASIGEGSLVLVVTPCEDGEPVAELEMDWREGSQRWFGHLRTKGWEPGCYEVRAMHDGVDVGGTDLLLTGKGPKTNEAKHEARAVEKAAAKADRTESKGTKGTKP